MALIRRNARPPLQLTERGAERQAEWVRILTHDPTCSEGFVAESSALGILALASSLLLFLALILMQPVINRFFPSPFPNLATLAFILFALAVSLYVTWLLRWLLNRRKPGGNPELLRVSTIGFLAVLTSLFLGLLLTEFLFWLFTSAGIQILINELFALIRWIG